MTTHKIAVLALAVVLGLQASALAQQPGAQPTTEIHPAGEARLAPRPAAPPAAEGAGAERKDANSKAADGERALARWVHDHADRDGDGVVDDAERRRLCALLERDRDAELEPAERARIRALRARLDRNGDGKLDEL
ncbi:MAG TPA: hypothetical protein VK081_08815, partial [Planctomycetota bacterium]|nr:hypothetical protein [Planctomycetota bacterium]